MTEDFNDIPAPAAALGVVGPDQAAAGPRFLPQQQILLYSSDEWEAFVHEWAHYCLKKLYTQVQRFTGPGDRGIDIAGFVDTQKLQGVWDNYQCKHYDHALQPGDVLPEIGKLLWHTFKKAYRIPRRYYFVAPHGVGTTVAGYLADSGQLKQAVIDKWEAQIGGKITKTESIVLEGAFLAYAQAFDFSIFDGKSCLQIVEEHRDGCPHHAARFGGGLPPRPDPGEPPEKIAPVESRYISQLLAAYADHKGCAVPDLQALKAWPPLNDHFGRQREAFYHAESLRVFARDTVPPGTFESLQDEIHYGVRDVHDADHPDGYMRVRKVTEVARGLNITANALIVRTHLKDRDGICHQLANEDRLKWIKP
jgi:hypothetical protein